MSANANPEAGGLRSRRLAKGLTQEQVASRAGCSTSYVRLLESGYAPASGEVLARVRRAVGEV